MADRSRASDYGAELGPGVGGQVLVRVDRQDPVAGRGIEAGVAGRREVVPPDVPADPRPEAAGNLRRRIGRSRVDHHDLVDDAREAGQAPLQDERFVPDDQAGRDAGRWHVFQYRR